MSIGPNWLGQMFHYTQLSPEGIRCKDPFGVGPVELSFDYYAADDWISIRQNGQEVALGPEEVRRLVQLLVGRYPLDALGGVITTNDD